MRALLIDIGNSRAKWRIVDPRLDRMQPVAQSGDDDRADAPGPSASLALADLPQLAQRLRAAHEPALDAVHLSNVAGAQAEAALRAAVSAVWGDVPVHALIPGTAQCGVANGYRDKAQLGPDRWAALLGAHALISDRHLLVCSFGTATTIDLLLVERDERHASFEGGLILPGFEAMRRALARDTARLPLAQGEVVDFAIATDDAIASGIAAAQAGAVAHALRNARMRAAASDRGGGSSRPFACVLAGGGANAMAGSLSDIDVDRHVVTDLVLCGLHAVARLEHDADQPRRPHHSTLVHERP